ncbi:MAG: ABC transporter permease [Candidatus Zixiibacteriota bacterium]
MKQFLHDLQAQKLRTFLTLVGLSWGTVTVICLLAFGYGLQMNQQEQMKGLGDNIVIMWASNTSKPYAGYPKGRWFGFVPDDIKMMRQNIPQLEAVSGEFQRGNIQIRNGRKSKLIQVSGIEPEFAPMRSIIPEAGGRFLNATDMNDKRRVAFIGNELRDEIFGIDIDPVGQAILLDNVPYTVIGVMVKKKQDSSYSGRDKDKAFIPSTTFQTTYGDRYLDNIVFRAQNLEVHKQAVDRAYEVFAKKYKFDPTDREALAMWDTVEGNDFLIFFVAMRMFVGFVGFMTLLVGGIGLANIMYVVVEERTKEIGIKMALGAKKGFVLSGFIFETFILTTIGGGIGYGIAQLIISIAPMFDIKDYVGTPTLSLQDKLAVVAILGIIGLMASFFPARRAANMNPVQALKL